MNPKFPAEIFHHLMIQILSRLQLEFCIFMDSFINTFLSSDHFFYKIYLACSKIENCVFMYLVVLKIVYLVVLKIKTLFLTIITNHFFADNFK